MMRRLRPLALGTLCLCFSGCALHHPSTEPLPVELVTERAEEYAAASPVLLTRDALDVTLGETRWTWEEQDPGARDATYWAASVEWEGSTHVVIADLVDGSCLRLVVPRLGTLDLEAGGAMEVMGKLLLLSLFTALSYEHEQAYFGWDPSDGEVRALLEIPLQTPLDAPLVERLVERLMVAVDDADSAVSMLTLAPLMDEDLWELFVDGVGEDMNLPVDF